MKTSKYILVGAIIALTTTSCSNFLEREPLTALSPTTFWNTEDDLRLGLNKLYDQMSFLFTRQS